MEDFIARNQLNTINEDSPRRTFQSSRGKSNIDLTIVTNQMLADVIGWEIAYEESASDHNILTFSINFEADKFNGGNSPKLMYTIKEQQHKEFYRNLFHIISKNFQIENNGGSMENIDEKLYTILTGKNNIRLFIEKIDDTVQETCRATCKPPSKSTNKVKGRTVPWWTDALTTMRKRRNALRRLYQRIKNNNDLRESRRKQYTTAKTLYQSAIKKEKNNILEKTLHCNITDKPMD